MSVTVESTNGLPRTVVWHQEGYKTTLGRRFVNLNSAEHAIFKDADCIDHIATALPALPLKPNEKDVGLLHLYAAHGLYPVVGWGDHSWISMQQSSAHVLLDYITVRNATLTHAITEQGERVEIAICDYDEAL